MLKVETLKALADIGFMAISNGLNSKSQSIFEAIKMIRPKSTLPHIGSALSQMNVGNSKDALVILEKASHIDSNDQIVKAFMGLAFTLLGRNTEGENCLAQVLKSKDKAAIKLANEFLMELKK